MCERLCHPAGAVEVTQPPCPRVPCVVAVVVVVIIIPNDHPAGCEGRCGGDDCAGVIVMTALVLVVVY